MAKRQEIQAYTVRNASGQYLGTFRTISAERAIQMLKDSQAQTSSFFKRQQAKLENLTAKVEG